MISNVLQTVAENVSAGADVGVEADVNEKMNGGGPMKAQRLGKQEPREWAWGVVEDVILKEGAPSLDLAMVGGLLS